MVWGSSQDNEWFPQERFLGVVEGIVHPGQSLSALAAGGGLLGPRTTAGAFAGCGRRTCGFASRWAGGVSISKDRIAVVVGFV
jgi:hypothetical protein